MYEAVKQLFDSTGWVRYHKKIARSTGPLAAIMLGQLIDKSIYWEKNKDNFKRLTGEDFKGEFFHTREDIEEETALSPHEQRKAEQILMQRGFITRSKKGLPAKNHYTINWSEIDLFLSTPTTHDNNLKSCTTSHKDLEPLVVKDFDSTKNKYTKNKQTNNKAYNMQCETSAGAEPSPCLDYENEQAKGNEALDPDPPEDPDPYEEASIPPSKKDINHFLMIYQATRAAEGLPDIKKYSKHINNLKDIDSRQLELMSKPAAIKAFFRYCDDRSYDIDWRHYECNSDRSPTIMFNDTVWRRFNEWVTAS